MIAARRTLLALVSVAAASAAASAAAAGPAWRLTRDAGVRTAGVSVEAVSFPGGVVRLYAMGGPGGVAVSRSGDGLSFTAESASVPRGAIDPAIVRLPDGRWRMYYVVANAPLNLPIDQQQREVRSAVSSDGLAWAEEPGVRLQGLHGVPDVVALPGGRWRMYYAGRSSDGRGPSIWSAVSSDGLVFAKEGERTPGNYYDPAVAQLGPSGWLLLAASQRPSGVQMYVGRSADGLDWTLEQEPVGEGFDPTLLEIGDRRFRVYYSVGSGNDATVVSGVLAEAAPPAPAATTTTTTPAKPKPKIPKCKKGQKPTKRKPCRK